jgi:hypothetical protein
MPDQIACCREAHRWVARLSPTVSRRLRRRELAGAKIHALRVAVSRPSELCFAAQFLEDGFGMLRWTDPQEMSCLR